MFIKRLLIFLISFQFVLMAFSQTLYIYGGRNHDVYLGKFNASKYDSESIWNNSGTYGSKYNSKSIWNLNGTFGDRYSQFSPWNINANNPPILKDEHGKEHGCLSANKYKVEYRYREIVECMVDNYERIAKDPAKWYDVVMK